MGKRDFAIHVGQYRADVWDGPRGNLRVVVVDERRGSGPLVDALWTPRHGYHSDTGEGLCRRVLRSIDRAIREEIRDE